MEAAAVLGDEEARAYSGPAIRLSCTLCDHSDRLSWNRRRLEMPPGFIQAVECFPELAPGREGPKAAVMALTGRGRESPAVTLTAPVIRVRKKRGGDRKPRPLGPLPPPARPLNQDLISSY